MKMKFKVLLLSGLILLAMSLVTFAGGEKKGMFMMPNVNEDMKTAEYWINKIENSDIIIMDKSEIEVFNKKTNKITQTKTFELRDYKEKVSEEQIKNYIKELSFPTKDRYSNGKKVVKEDYEKIRINMNVNAIIKKVDIEYGFTTKRTDMRTFPTQAESLGDPMDIEFDYFQETALEIAEPLVVLHKSMDRKWLFVQTGNYRGWVLAKDTAISKNRKKWLKYIDNTNFIVVLGNRIKLGVNPFSKNLSELEIGMGTKLSLVEKNNIPQLVDNQMPDGNFVAEIPTSDSNGELTYKMVLIPLGSDVSIGYLPYTRANIIKQAFKTFGERYGWGGMFNSRDCSSFMCDVYKSFGIFLPRNTSQQAISAGKTINVEGKTYDEIKKTLLSYKPGAAIYMKGHGMLYLGEDNGQAYIIHSVYSYGDKTKPNADGSLPKIVINGTVISDLDIQKRGNGKTFIENLKCIKQIEE